MEHMEKQMELFSEGGLRDEGGTVEPESGNEVPSGSLKKEVADELFKNLGKKFLDNGATIIGGCCETNPIHISLLSKLKKDFA